ncbi:MAG: pilus assembly protein, partial [Panacagrimonas sp.]
FQKGVVTPSGARKRVRTYTIDVFNAQPNADHTSLMQSAARVGGGKYYEARNQKAIFDAIQDIFSDIQSVSSTFTSASLPISATNRSQSDNQVYIGMFRPDSKAMPRWFGNLKQYQLIIGTDGSVKLGDTTSPEPIEAVNPQTGFVTECARSAWTFNTGDYFANAPWIDPTPASLCTSNANPFSDAPDGPRVEKGGVAQIIRSGNNPPATSSAPDYLFRRNVKTLSATADNASMVSFDTSSATGLPTLTVDFTLGKDVGPVSKDLNEPEYVALTPDTVPQKVEVRVSVHGDVIHSRPQPVNYGGSTGTVVYYGANDGHFRAISGATGKELWSFIAPEFLPRLERLHQNSPYVLFPNPANASSILSDDGVPRKPKDYFFDGSVGVYQTAGSSAVNLYVSQRRGGRMIYAFNVKDPADPKFLWRRGCPNLTDDSGCSGGMSEIGQTWATPAVGLVKGYSDTRPVVFIAGGHDACEDKNDMAPACSTAKGRVVYALDGLNGDLLATFGPPTGVTDMRSVVADLALVDPDLDGYVDHAYAADMGGSLFRIDLSKPLTGEPLANSDWTMSRIARTTGGARKFQFAPALIQAKGTVYVAVGTGDREHPLIDQYAYTDPVINRFYLFADKFDGTPVSLDDTAVMNDVSTGLPKTGCDAEVITPASTKRGWFFDLTDNGRGEQVVTSAAVVGGLVAFSTNRPTPEEENSCGANLGEARGYLVNLLTGSGVIGPGNTDCGQQRSSVFEGGGLPPSPVLATVPIDGELRTVVIGAVQKTGEPSSPIEAQRVRPPIASDRKPIYWYKSTGDR